jgi:class 3 adenylate cyclase
VHDLFVSKLALDLKVLDVDEVDISNIDDHTIALRANATSLFCDFAGTTSLISKYDNKFSTWILKSYLYYMSSVAQHHGGLISAFEGDGLLVSFFGDDQIARAIECARVMNFYVRQKLNNQISAHFPNIDYNAVHVIGIDKSYVTFIDVGLPGCSHKLCVGTSVNNSANFTRINDVRFNTYVTESVYRGAANKFEFIAYEDSLRYHDSTLYTLTTGL